MASADSGLHDATKVVAGALDAAQWNFLEKQLQLDVQTKPPQAERPEVAAVAQAVAGLEVAASAAASAEAAAAAASTRGIPPLPPGPKGEGTGNKGGGKKGKGEAPLHMQVPRRPARHVWHAGI